MNEEKMPKDLRDQEEMEQEILLEGPPMPADPPVLTMDAPLWTERETVEEDVVEPAEAAVVSGDLAGAARELHRLEGEKVELPEEHLDTFVLEATSLRRAVEEAAQLASAMDAEKKAVRDATALMPEDLVENADSDAVPSPASEEPVAESSDTEEASPEDTAETTADLVPSASKDEEDEEDQEDGPGKKKRRGRYKYHLEPDEYMWLLMHVDELNGSRKKTMRTVKLLLVVAMLPIIDACLHPGYWLALLAGLVLMLIALQLKNVTRKNAKRAVKAEPGGPTLLVQAGEKGLLLQSPGRPQVVLPYDHMQKVYRHGGYGDREYLSIITGPKTSAFIPCDAEHRGYRAIERRLRQKCGARFIVEKDEKDASKNKG